MNDSIQITGEIKEYIDGELVCQTFNTIHDELLNNFRVMLFSSVNIGLGNDNSLFTSANIRNQQGSAEEGNDGIVLKDGNYSGQNNPYFTMETTYETKDISSGFGVQLEGQMQASEARSVTELVIGGGLHAGSSRSSIFGVNTAFAFNDKSDSPVSLSQDILYTVTWTIRAS